MAAITLSPAERERLRDELQNYCAENFNVELEQFDAEFFLDFICEKLGPVFLTRELKKRSAPISPGANGFQKRWI